MKGASLILTKLTAEMQQNVEKRSSLKRYLESLTVGKGFTPRSWLYEDLEPDKVLDLWMKQLSTLQNGSPEEENVFQFDTSQLSKWGPQGGVAPIAELMDEVVLPTFGKAQVPKAFKTEAWKRAKAKATALLKTVGKAESLRPASYKSVVEDMRARDTLESNSGWPYFSRRSIDYIKQQSIEEAENGLWKTYPAIALFRNYNGKTRLVWMFPMSANLVEGSFFQPLQSKLMNSPLAEKFLSPWKGFEQVRLVVTAAYKDGDSLAASDFSSTDAHFTRYSSLEVFDVIAPCFQYKYRNLLKESILHMHEIPLVVGPDQMLTGWHGVSSGSNWTNFIETIFDLILSLYVEELGYTGYNGLYAIGDDMAWSTNNYSEKFAEQLAEIGESVGQVIKAEKTTNDPGKVKSLQRLFQRGYERPDGLLRAVYSTIRALKSAMFPERFHKPKLWSSDMFCARIFMILENCVDHPLFEDFVKFVCAGNRHLIPFAKKSSAELNEITRKTKLLPGFNPTYNQERRDTSLASFESIKIARAA
nr:MAG: RNA-dependent RNA polymerase [Porcine picobirnavirus]